MTATKVMVCVHHDDADLMNALVAEFPDCATGVPRPMGAELEMAIAIVNLTAASIELFCTIAERFKHREKSYVIVDGKHIALGEVKKEIE